MFGRLQKTRVQVVVTGHQKSGTTAIAELLGRLCGLAVSSDPLFQVDQGAGQIAEDLMTGRRRLARVAFRHRRLFFQPLVKEPDLAFIWDEAGPLYRNARCVFVARHPLQTIRSILDRLGLPGISEPAALSNMKQPTVHWRRILDGRLPPVQGVDYVERLARRWQLAADAYASHRESFLLVRYEDFLRSKLRELNRIADALGLERCHDVTRELDRPYQPKGNASRDPAEVFGVEQMSRLLAVCERGMREFGYGATVGGVQADVP